MPLLKRVISPIHVSRDTLPQHVQLTNDLEGVNNGTLANLIRQLSSLSKHAEDMFGELSKELEALHTRSCKVQARVDHLAVKVVGLDSTVEEVSLRDIHLRKAFRSNIQFDQQVVSKLTIPTAMADTYHQCDKPPPLDKLNCYRDDGKDGLKYYTNPSQFFELWRQDMLKDTERLIHDKGRKPHRGRNEGGNGGGRHGKQKRVRQPHNTREKHRENAIKQGEYISPHNALYQSPQTLYLEDGTLVPDASSTSRPPRPNSIEVKRNYSGYSNEDIYAGRNHSARSPQDNTYRPTGMSLPPPPYDDGYPQYPPPPYTAESLLAQSGGSGGGGGGGGSASPGGSTGSTGHYQSSHLAHASNHYGAGMNMHHINNNHHNNNHHQHHHHLNNNRMTLQRTISGRPSQPPPAPPPTGPMRQVSSSSMQSASGSTPTRSRLPSGPIERLPSAMGRESLPPPPLPPVELYGVNAGHISHSQLPNPPYISSVMVNPPSSISSASITAASNVPPIPPPLPGNVNAGSSSSNTSASVTCSSPPLPRESRESSTESELPLPSPPPSPAELALPCMEERSAPPPPPLPLPPPMPMMMMGGGGGGSNSAPNALMNGDVRDSKLKATAGSPSVGSPGRGGGDESVQSAPMIQLAKSSGRSGNPQAAPAMDGRCDLLKAIRDGICLRKVEKGQQREVEKGRMDGLHDVASILARRVAMEFSDSESGSESGSGSDWDDETSA